MKRGQGIQNGLRYLCLLCVIALGVITIIASGNDGARDNIEIPKDLLVFDGWPSGINNANDANEPIAAAAQEFGRYDYVILGSGLEKTSHVAHDATVQIIAHADANDTVFFGCIGLGVSTDNHSIAEIKTRVDEWIATGADGIFYDDFGYNFSVTRARQNEAVSYVHSKGIPAVVNALEPDDALCSLPIIRPGPPRPKPNMRLSRWLLLFRERLVSPKTSLIRSAVLSASAYFR